MAQKARALVLVIGAQLEPRQQRTDRNDDLVRGLVLKHTVVHTDDVMARRLIDAGNDLSSARDAERRLHLVPVMQRPRHAEDLFHMAETLEMADALCLLEGELLVIGHVLQLAAAALFIKRTAVASARFGFADLFVHVLSAVFFHAAPDGELQNDERRHRAESGDRVAFLIFHFVTLLLKHQ